MKKIGLISDTHGWLDKAVFRHFDSCDEVWHAGDIGTTEVLFALQEFKPLRAVWGNIDDSIIRQMCPEHQFFRLEGVDFWITHIGGRPGNYASTVRHRLKHQPPQVFICGHSHLCLVQMDKSLNMLYLNPGAAGKHGFHKMRTLLRFGVRDGKLEQMEVIELGARG